VIGPVVDALVLAAGASERLGRCKQLLPFAGTTLVGHAVACARAAGVRRVLAVIGARAGELRPELQRLAVECVDNPDWREGLGSSIRAGVQALDGDDRPDAILILLSDQPRVAAADLRRIVERGRERPHAIVAAAYRGTVGVPALFPRAQFAELRALGGALGAKALLRAHAMAVEAVPCAAASVDIDTEEDYERLLLSRACGSSLSQAADGTVKR
jgi:molybdenum cofactor cytidylyltransferase